MLGTCGEPARLITFSREFLTRARACWFLWPISISTGQNHLIPLVFTRATSVARIVLNAVQTVVNP